MSAFPEKSTKKGVCFSGLIRVCLTFSDCMSGWHLRLRCEATHRISFFAIKVAKALASSARTLA